MRYLNTSLTGKGCMKDGEDIGMGTFHHDNGVTITGMFEDSSFNGMCTIAWGDGFEIESEFRDGAPAGKLNSNNVHFKILLG